MCRPESRLLSDDLAALLGYAPRADVVLTCQQDGRRLWIEFEVSRADPVANHAKFATAHLFQPQAAADVFVSMVSRHVDRGRRNLAANTIFVMRRIGMTAVQTVLFPTLSDTEVQRFNHMTPEELRATGPDVSPEVDRVFVVTTPQGTADGHRIFFAGDVIDVLLNARQWNAEVTTSRGRTLWGRRRVQYFVYVPYSGEFAPSKFCAYLPIRTAPEPTLASPSSHMTLEVYAALDESESRFDGHIARNHLTRHLGMVSCVPESSPKITDRFQQWMERVSDFLVIPSRGPVFLCPANH
jgi:hypothetical protein